MSAIADRLCLLWFACWALPLVITLSVLRRDWEVLGMLYCGFQISCNPWSKLRREYEARQAKLKS